MYFMSQHHSAHVISREFRGAARIFSRAGKLGQNGMCKRKIGEKGKRVNVGGYGDIHPPADWRIL